jgi:hypothetical protein
MRILVAVSGYGAETILSRFGFVWAGSPSCGVLAGPLY